MKRKKKKISFFDNFEIDIKNKKIDFLSIEEATELIILRNIKNLDKDFWDSPHCSLLKELGDIFYYFCYIWEKDVIEISNFPLFLKMKSVIPFLNISSLEKYNNKKPGSKFRENILKKFIDPLNKENDLRVTIYYPFPIISCNENNNHSLFAMYEEGIKNKDYLNNTIRTYNFIYIEKIIENIYFKKNKIILKNVSEKSEHIAYKIKYAIENSDFLCQFLFNCIFNRDWRYKNTFKNDSIIK